MAKPKEIRVDSISSFTGKIEQLLEVASKRYPTSQYEGNWYRGIGASNRFTLLPTLYRHPTLSSIDNLIILERKMMQDFERQNVLHTRSSASAAEQDDLRTLFYMQHYAVPTRLLDWSNNPFIALYFALSSAPMDSVTGKYLDDAAVWVLDPVAWNKIALVHVSHGDGGPLSDETALESYGPRKLYIGKLQPTAISTLNERPAAILGVANNARMFAQRGVFTIFGRNLMPMEEQYDSGKFLAGSLTKLVIPAAKIGDILTTLLRIGYTDSVSYPDLHGLAMEIKRSRGFKV